MLMPDNSLQCLWVISFLGSRIIALHWLSKQLMARCVIAPNCIYLECHAFCDHLSLNLSEVTSAYQGPRHMRKQKPEY
jgi:hypothetical protein